MNSKELALKIHEKKKIVSGHRTCPGCPICIILRTALASTDDPVVVASATSCAEVTTTIYPYTSWNISWIHSLFANSAATMSGVESAYLALKKKGKIKEDIKFLVFGGDGGTFDIGLQSLSGALERGDNFVYICYDNEGYMNTGNQRSSATPMGASTSTTPSGKRYDGKKEFPKDLAKIAIAHNIPYVATINPADLGDMYEKVKKAFEKKGPSVLIAFAACPTNMKAPSNQTISISKLAIETNSYPLYEYEDGKYKVNYKPEKKAPVEELLKTQTKFNAVMKNKKEIQKIQEYVDKEWKELLLKEKMTNMK
jgi:pyruvate ferredoxin oxidoreductase beta subunit